MSARRPKRLTEPNAAAKLLTTMTTLERRAHAALASELTVTDRELAKWAARALRAAKILYASGAQGHGALVCDVGPDPAAMPTLSLHREPAAKVVDLTAYRLERQNRAARDG